MQKIRRYFHDWEFLDEENGDYRLRPISVGVVDEDGGEFYAVYDTVNIEEYGEANPWLKDNVLAKLPPRDEWKPGDYIRQRILDMIQPAETVEFWARQGFNDHFLLCRLFGGLTRFKQIMKEEKGAGNVVFRDIYELRREFGEAATHAEEKEETKHIAIYDARQEKKDYNWYEA